MPRWLRILISLAIVGLLAVMILLSLSTAELPTPGY